ncbi:hypothetical protein [Endozoicomonas sp.]|uniref:hypothetical protein n=1 Tax=Endozoicomonas sp. TaxID=1892382 RepID=UPI00383B6048
MDKAFFTNVLNVIKKQAEKACHDRKNKTEKEKQLKKKPIIENQCPQKNISPAQTDRQKVIKQHSALITKTEELLENFKKDLLEASDYKTELEKLDDVFKTIADQPELQAWVYGDIAHDLCEAYSKEFTRGELFVKAINAMGVFCTEILKELGNAIGKRDRHWLYMRNPEQPISKRSIINLGRTSDPEKIQSLVKRALSSVSLYQKALNKAKTVVSNPLPEMMLKTGKDTRTFLIFPKERQLLSDRISFINDEIKSVQQHLLKLQDIPAMSDIFSAVSQIFKQLQPPVRTSTTLHSKNASRGNTNNNDSDDKEFAKLVKKSKTEWKLDTSITETQKSANEQLERIMKEFTDLQEQLTQERLKASSTI